MAGEFIEIISEQTKAQIDAIMPLVNELANKIKDINSFKASGTPSGADKNIKGLSDAYKEQAKSIEQVKAGLEKTSAIQKQIEQSSKNQTSSTQKLTKSELDYVSAIERGVKAKEREILANKKLSDAYKEQASILQQKEYNELVNQSTQRMTEMGKSSNTLWSKMSSGLQSTIQLLGIYSGALLAIRAIKKTIGLEKDFGEGVSQLAIYLNNSKEAADEVFNSLKKIDTRTSLTDLLGLSEIVAKKGVAQEAIAGIVTELDKLFIVMGKGMGDKEEATSSIIKLISIFNRDGQVTEDRIKGVGASLQYLTTHGVATGEYLVGFSERLGAMRSVTGQSQSEILGLGAAFEQTGLQMEVGANATGQIITKMMSNVDKFAKASGMSRDKLKFLLETNSTEALLQFATGIKKASVDSEDFAKRLESVGLRGVRMKSALAEVAGNVDLFREKVNGSNKAIEDLDKLMVSVGLKQNTFAATLEKVNKQFQLIASSQGVQDTFSNIAIGVLKVTQAIASIPFSAIVAGLSAWTSYKIMLNKAIIENTFAQTANNLAGLKSVATGVLARTGILGEAKANEYSSEALGEKVIALNLEKNAKLQNIAITNLEIASIEKEIVATGLSTDAQLESIVAKKAIVASIEAEVVATEASIVATEGLAATLASTGWGTIAVAIGVAVYALYEWITAETEAEKQQKDLIELREKNSKALGDSMSNNYKIFDESIKKENDILRQRYLNHEISYNELIKLQKDKEKELIENKLKSLDSGVSEREKKIKELSTPIAIPKLVSISTGGGGSTLGGGGTVDNQKEINAAVKLENLRQKKLLSLSQEKDAVDKVRTHYLRMRDDIKEAEIRLEEDKKQNGSKRERTHLDLTEVISAAELRKAELEREKSDLESRMNNEETSLNDRLKLRSEFSAKSIEILDNEYEKEKAIIYKKTSDDLIKNDLAKKNKEITTEEYDKNKIAVANRTSNELAKIDIIYSEKWNDLMDNDANYYKKIQKQKRDATDETNKIILNIEKDKFDKIAKNEEFGLNYSLKARQKAFDASVDLTRKEIDLQYVKDKASSTSDEETKKIEANYKKANIEINNIISPMKQAHEETKKFIESFSDGALEKSLDSIGLKSAKMFLDFQMITDPETGKTSMQSTFEKLWEGAETTKEKFALAFQGIGDIVQDAMAIADEAKQKKHEKALARLEKEKDIVLGFAGDSASAKAKIEADYDKKKKALEVKEFKRKQKMAMVNIAIDTAQAIAVTFSELGWPAGIAGAAIMFGLGAIQEGIVASQKPPEYWTGTDNAEAGIAWVDERGAEIVTNKSGHIKSFGDNKGAKLMNLEKGDKVYTAQETKRLMFDNELNSIMMDNGISNAPKVVVNAGMSKSDMRDVMIETIGSMGMQSTIIDKNGLQHYVSNGHSKTIFNSNRVSGKGIRV